MNSAQFVSAVRCEVLESNLTTYKELFAHTNPDSAQDAYWNEALRFVNNMSPLERAIFFKIIRQIMVDTISSVFGLMDGVARLRKQDGQFDLLLAGKRLNGDLQTDFLRAEENEQCGG